MIAKAQPAQRPTRPAPNQPGSLGQQFAAIVGFLSVDTEVRQIDRAAAWEAAQDKVMPHRRTMR